MAELQVRSVRGRYPHRGVLRPQNIESQVIEEVARVLLRLGTAIPRRDGHALGRRRKKWIR